MKASGESQQEEAATSQDALCRWRWAALTMNLQRSLVRRPVLLLGRGTLHLLELPHEREHLQQCPWRTRQAFLQLVALGEESQLHRAGLGDHASRLGREGGGVVADRIGRA